MRKLDGGSRAGYVFNTTIAGIEDADALPDRRVEPALGSADHQRADPQTWLRGGFMKVGIVGENVDLTYEQNIWAPDRTR